MESSAEHPEIHATIRLIQDEDAFSDDQPLAPLPDVIAQPILDREARVEARARHRAESNHRSQIANRFASLIGQLHRRHK